MKGVQKAFKNLVYLSFEGTPKFCYLFTKKKQKMVLDEMMMIIKKEEKKDKNTLSINRVKQLVTTYPPLGSG